MDAIEPKISEQQKKWIRRLADGIPTNKVAKEFRMPPGTFAYKLNLLRERLGCENMAALIAFFLRNKIID